MKRNRTHRLLSLAALAIALLAAAGCESDSDPLAPGTGDQVQAPVLPDPAQLVPDLSFFDDGKAAAKSFTKANFLNAYLRVVYVDAMVKLLLAPPVAAFAVALHTIPSPQADGSWLWVYTHVDGDRESQIRLRGRRVGDEVEWELRVTCPYGTHPLDRDLWFRGTTRDDGRFGSWTFFDPTLAGQPAVASLAWGTGLDGDVLSLTCLHGEDAGDVLSFRRDAPECELTLHDASAVAEYYIRWNEADGTGSLRVPDYNDGQPACWDGNQDDAECAELT